MTLVRTLVSLLLTAGLAAGCAADSPARLLAGATFGLEPPGGPALAQDLGEDVPLLGAFRFTEDFEAGLGSWHAEGGSAGLGWTAVTEPTRRGERAMAFGRADRGPFSAAAEATLTLSAPLDLHDIDHPYLVFYLRGRADPPTSLTLAVEARRPGGRWLQMGAAAEAGYARLARRVVELSELAGGPAELRFRAVARSPEVPTTGWVLDDVYMVDASRPL